MSLARDLHSSWYYNLTTWYPTSQIFYQGRPGNYLSPTVWNDFEFGGVSGAQVYPGLFDIVQASFLDAQSS